jgi:hypothetical protein
MDAIELWWLPLGAGGHSVRFNGRVYEAAAAALGRRERRDLYHAALRVRVADELYAIELAPATAGAVACGAVGTRALGRFRVFRYELRCRRDGRIPDLAHAVESPRSLTGDPRRLLDLVSRVPTATWGRDELGAGEMWTSNSVVSWLLVTAGVDLTTVRPPAGGRAPGWDAGVAVALRRGATRRSCRPRAPSPARR